MSTSGVPRWPDIRSAVEAALALPPDERPAFLQRACGDDASLRAEVEALVAACERVGEAPEFLGRSAAAFAAPILTRAPRADGDGATAKDACGPPAWDAALREALGDRYELAREIGHGGTATVYLARDHRHHRSVAIKVLDPVVGAAMSGERFEREIRLTAALAHPHILPLHDSGEAAGRLFYVMPYVDGETLRERLARDGALGVADVVRLMRELADALAYAHARGVVHRDIKPGNILFQDGHAVLADFGIARALRQARELETDDAAHQGASGEARPGRPGDGTLTRGGASPGTPAYMAPEQARGDAAVDHRADLYALGVVAYESLAGTHPFDAGDKQAMLAAHLEQIPHPLGARRADVPPALAALVTHLLEKDPTDRPQTAGDVLRALEHVSAVAPRSRRRAVARGALAGVLVAASAAAYVTWRTRAAPPATSVSAAHDGAVASSARTVAVLPFVDDGGGTGDEYFSEGLRDELAHAIAALPGIRVAGRTSSYAFKGRSVSAQEIGRALDVGALVEGTVRRSNDRLRVTTQLVATADGTVLWDSVYERRAGHVFALQNEFTRAIIAALGPTLRANGGGPLGAPPTPSAIDHARGTTDQVAYDLYLRGRYYWLQRSAVNLGRAISYFRQAIARDPSFARAHAGLAMSYAVLPVYFAGPSDSVATLVMASARRALAIDSTLADAHLALGVGLDMRLRFRDALAQYRAGLALDSTSVTAYHWLGISLLNLGHTDEAIGLLRRATRIDPLAVSPAAAYATALLFARRFPEAIDASRRVLALDSTFMYATWTLGLAQAFGGQPNSAVMTLERATRQHPDDSRPMSALAFAYAAAGRWSEAARIRAALHRPGVDRSGGTHAAFADLVFGEREPIVRELTSVAGERRLIVSGDLLGCNPLLDPLWTDARFRTAMQALSVAACPLAKPWPLPPRVGAAGTQNGRRRSPNPEREKVSL